MSRRLFPAFLPIGSAVVSRAADFALIIAAGRFLGSVEFGAFAFLMVIVGLTNALVSGGGDMWLNRFTRTGAGKTGRAPLLWRYYLATAGAIAVSCLTIGAAMILAVRAGWISIGEIEAFYFAAGLAVAAAVVAGFAETMCAIIRAAGHVTFFFVVRDIVRPVAILAAIVFIAPQTPDAVIGTILAVWSAVLVAVAVFARCAGANLLPAGRFRLRLWKRLWRHTATLIAGNLTSRLAAYIDVLVLVQIVGLASVGEYRAAAQFAIGFMIVQHFVFLGLPWQIHQRQGAGADDEAHRTLTRRQRLLIVLSACALLVLAALGEFILGLVGPRFVSMAPVFSVFLFIRFTELLWGPQHEILISNGHAARDAGANVAGLIVWATAFVAGSLVLSPIPAAVAAAAMASIAIQGVRYVALRQAGLRSVFGHPVGPPLPIAMAGLAVMAAALML